MGEIHLQYYYDLFREKWWVSSNTFKLNIDKISYFQKKRREKELDKLIDTVVNHIKSFPKSEVEKKQWKSKGDKFLRELMKKDKLFKLENFDENLKERFFKSTENFIKASREFDKKLKLEDIGQAMRNVWIINILQAVMGEEVSLTKAIFGYSMLYPYTDNYLDDIAIGSSEKSKFNNRLQERLKGENISSNNNHEAQVYKLVENIEEVFPRREYPKVYESLLQINNGQIRSLEQQEEVTIPYDKDILGISILKGGSSVLVDGYLVRGEMIPEEIEFCMGYGFLLQLGDDLQDVKEDLKNNHITLMSQLAGKYYLDTISNKLINFTIDLVDNLQCKNKDNEGRLKELIKNNCIMLILFSIGLSKEYFSKEYVKTIEEYLPFTIDYLENLKPKITKKLQEIKDAKGISGERLMYILDEVVSLG